MSLLEEIGESTRIVLFTLPQYFTVSLIPLLKKIYQK